MPIHWAFLLALLVASPAAAGEPVSFKNDVMAVLSRAGCNAGACHGNLNGKGGFKLSLRGQDPDADLAALTRDMLARRADPASPDESLLLKKASGRLPHEGGARFSVLSTEYAVLRSWVAGGCRPDAAGTRKPVRLDVAPTHTILPDPVDRVRITAVAHYSDGSKRDVTGLSAFDPNVVGVADVKPTGEVVKQKDGDLVVLVRYLDLQVPVRLAFIPDRPAVGAGPLASGHPIDKLVAGQLKELRLRPSELAPDSVFVRRAYLDACGITPTAEEARRFLADPSPDKRERLIDELLGRQEFAEYWALKWSDLLRNEEKSLDRKGVQVYHRWIKGWFAADKPLTDFAREVLTARGSTYQNPAANFYRAVRDPYQRAESVAQVFLGVRVGCAKCHNHPFDRWTQDDYHQFVAFFPRVQYRVLENAKRDNLDKHEFVGDQVVYAARDGSVPLPRTGGPAAPKLLGADTPDLADADRLDRLAEWVAGPTNPFFAKAQANRVWYHLTGRGLVDPNDDFRTANPPSNPALLDWLAADFAANGYRLRPLVRRVMTSRAYQLASSPNETNADDESHGSRALVQPLEAEPLIDALSRFFDLPVKFNGYPAGTRAGAMAAMMQSGTRRTGDPSMGERFMKVFGKPDRLLTCECERSDDAGLLQAFQLINGAVINDLLRNPDNRLGKLLAAGKPAGEVLDELYLAALCRHPTAAERGRLLGYVAGATDKRGAWEDVAWGLVNAKEFLLRR